jgi:hypothetical protein
LQARPYPAQAFALPPSALCLVGRIVPPLPVQRRQPLRLFEGRLFTVKS